MVNQHNKIISKLNIYDIILLACILSPLLLMNSHYDNNQNNKQIFYEEKNKFFGKILKNRKLQEINEVESFSSIDSNNICEKAHKELREYYSNGELLKFVENYTSISCKDKDKNYLKALINIIKTLIDNKNKKKEKYEIDSIKNDLITYNMHIFYIFIFLVIGILSIPAWPICCICYCCNCCCCCCCKYDKCRISCLIFTFLFSTSATIICIKIHYQSNSIFVGIADINCSMLKFFEQILEGETKETLPKWGGIDEISGILQDIVEQIKKFRNGTLNDLNQKISEINYKKNYFQNKMEINGKEFYNINTTTYNDLYSSNEYFIPTREISGRYVLDIVKMFGKKVDGIDEEKYEPKNSILDLWHQEYKVISKNADNYLEEAISNFQIISENNNNSNGDVIESLMRGVENLNKLKDFFNNIKEQIEDVFIDNSYLIDKYGKIGFKLLIDVMILLNFFLLISIFFVFLSSLKRCLKFRSCRCLFIFLTHLFWNILYLLMIISFMVGFIFSFIGTLGNDMVSIISFIVSKDNIGVGVENIMVEPLGEAKDYLDICVNGDGNIIK